jgi:hypothetical protein
MSPRGPRSPARRNFGISSAKGKIIRRFNCADRIALDKESVHDSFMSEEIPSSSETAELARIRLRIESLVNKHFATGADIYYLSQLGNDLGSDRLLLEKLTHQKLSEFIQKEFNFKICITGEHQNVLYMVRPGHSISEIPTPKPGTTRYASRFWAAFSIPLTEGEHRFIDIHTLAFGSDESSLKGTGTDIREIRPEFIVPHGTYGSATEIADRIERWLDEQQLDRFPFLAQRSQSARDARPSLLDQLLDALDGGQLKRISLPLDIIRTLSERRGR